MSIARPLSNVHSRLPDLSSDRSLTSMFPRSSGRRFLCATTPPMVPSHRPLSSQQCGRRDRQEPRTNGQANNDMVSPLPVPRLHVNNPQRFASGSSRTHLWGRWSGEPEVAGSGPRHDTILEARSTATPLAAGAGAHSSLARLAPERDCRCAHRSSMPRPWSGSDA